MKFRQFYCVYETAILIYYDNYTEGQLRLAASTLQARLHFS